MVDGRPLSSTNLRFRNRKERKPRGQVQGGGREKASFQGKVFWHHMNDQWYSTSLIFFFFPSCRETSLGSDRVPMRLSILFWSFVPQMCGGGPCRLLLIVEPDTLSTRPTLGYENG